MVTTTVDVTIPEKKKPDLSNPEILKTPMSVAVPGRFPSDANMAPRQSPTGVSDVAGAPPAPGVNPNQSTLDILQQASADLDNLRTNFNASQAGDREPTIEESFVASSSEPEVDKSAFIPEEVDEDQLTRNQLRLYQQEIDATNQIYDQLLNEARLEGQGRLGSQRAMSARGGLLGSDFAGAQKDRVQNFNTDINRGIQAERAAKIGSIMGNVRQSVVDELAEKRAARQQGAENYLSYLASSRQRKENNLNNLAQDFISQGFDPAELDETELQEIANEAGTTTRDIIARYQRALAGGGAEGGDQFTLSEGEQRFDAAGNLIAAGPDSPAGSGKIYSTSKGLVRIGDDGNPELIFGTSGGGSGGGSTGEIFKSGGLEIPGSEVSQLERSLNQSRDENGFTDPTAYTTSLNEWTANNGLEDDFFKLFPPDEWVDPSDSSLPKRIRDRASESSSGGFTIGGTTFSLNNSNESEEEVSDTGAITGDDSPWWNFWD